MRDRYGRLVARRNFDGTELCSLVDGQGNVMALEDPGTIVAGYDLCHTGNEADGPNRLPRAAQTHPFRLGSAMYDDDLKDCCERGGLIAEDDAGAAT